MKIRGLGTVLFGAILAACSSGADLSDGSVGSSAQEIVGPSSNGGRNEVVMLYMTVTQSDGSQATRTCSGSYFAPRVVLTAAHCLDNVFADQLFVYYGDNFAADFGQLVPGPNGLLAPAPGQPSAFAQADSYEQHPDYLTSGNSPDVGVVYLDRKPPFDPLPLYRTTLASNRAVTISGWGTNNPANPTSGARVQRTGNTKTLGSPTTADNHPEDPNPALNTAASRAAQIKLDGAAPNANSCFGDSGGPILVTENGQTYIAGVNYFTGVSCAKYSLAFRTSSVLPFLDQAYKKGGQEVLTPTFDCVAPNASGSLTAFYGYNNKNGVNVSVPYGTKNAFARDTASARPKLFAHGQHDFSFGVDFTSSQSLSWTLSPDNSPTTTLNVSQSSRRCGAAEADQTQCALACRASQRSGCAGLPSFEDCVTQCLGTYGFIDQIFPNCHQSYTAFNQCTAGVSSTPSNWDCFDGATGTASGPCATQIDALNTCFSQ